MKRGLLVRRVTIGICALVLWMLMFAGGLLLETVEYRAFLAPHAFPKHAVTDATDGIAVEPYKGSTFFAFAAATLWFTPTNLALLALLAGLLGG